ncbi:hypothetical protein ES707_12289 [subsurface metagenome]
MSGPPAGELAQAVSQALESKGKGHDLGMAFKQRDDTGYAEKVRGGQEEQVEAMALQGFAVFSQEAEPGSIFRDEYAKGIFGGPQAGQAVPKGAYTANPGSEETSAGIMLALKHCLEVARGLDHVPAGFLKLPVLYLHHYISVPLNPGQMMDIHIEIEFHSTPSKPPKKLRCSSSSFFL